MTTLNRLKAVPFICMAAVLQTMIEQHTRLIGLIPLLSVRTMPMNAMAVESDLFIYLFICIVGTRSEV